MNPSEIFSKVPPKNEPFEFFSSKGAAKTLWGRNPAIFRGVADKKWNDPSMYSVLSHCVSEFSFDSFQLVLIT